MGLADLGLERISGMLLKLSYFTGVGAKESGGFNCLTATVETQSTVQNHTSRIPVL